MGSQSLLVLPAPTMMIPSKIAASSLAPPRPGPLCFPRALTITDSVVFRVKSNSARNKLASSIRCGMCNIPLVLFSVIATILFLLLSKAGVFFFILQKNRSSRNSLSFFKLQRRWLSSPLLACHHPGPWPSFQWAVVPRCFWLIRYNC